MQLGKGEEWRTKEDKRINLSDIFGTFWHNVSESNSLCVGYVVQPTHRLLFPFYHNWLLQQVRKVKNLITLMHNLKLFSFPPYSFGR